MVVFFEYEIVGILVIVVLVVYEEGVVIWFDMF